MFALSFNHSNIGTIRETFFLNALSTQHEVNLSQHGDFLVDQHIVFEIGGRKKGLRQIKEAKNAYLACDDIETGMGSKIPLWLFGFLY